MEDYLGNFINQVDVSFNYIVLAYIALFLICGILGYKKGFTKMCFFALSIIIMLIATPILKPKIPGIIDQNRKIINTIEKEVDKRIEIKASDKIIDSDTYINSLNIPDTIKELLRDNIPNIEGKTEATALKMERIIEEKISEAIYSVTMTAITVGLLYIILFIIRIIISIIVSLPIISTVDAYGGLALGLVKALILTWISFILIDALFMTEIGAVLSAQINDDAMLKTLYDMNIIRNLIM